MPIAVNIDGTKFVLGTVGIGGMTSESGIFDPTNVCNTQNTLNPQDFILGSDFSNIFFSMTPGDKITCGKNTLTCISNTYAQDSNTCSIYADVYLYEFDKTFDLKIVSYSTGGVEQEEPFFIGITNNKTSTGYLRGVYMFSYQDDEKLYIGCPTRVDDEFSYLASNQADIAMSYTKVNGKWVPDRTPDPSGDTSVGSYAKCFFWFLLGSIVDSNDDPFNPGGGSETGGGDGDFDNTSIPIEIPGLPTVSAASTGFISLFNPTLSQLNELASYMWSDTFDIDTLKKLFADPMDVILGLSILPVQIPTSGAREVKVGNIGTGISLNVASTQFVEVDCGTINVNEYWGAYLDYSPYTHAQIYLPYVGVRPISVDEIMGKSVNVNYHVDILTGACCCFVKCGDSVLYSFNGQCSIPIPISATNYTNTINGIISVAASLGTMVATGGATAPLALTNLASTVANQMKPTVEKSGAISGPGGVMGIQTPYLILTRPRQALPSKQNTFIGYPSFITVTLGELSGYTEVHSIHLENIPATADELSEIETLLKGGVIF